MQNSARKELPSELEAQLQGLKAGARKQRSLTSAEKNRALMELAIQVEASQASILGANAQDLSALPATATSAFRDRLTLNPARIANMAESLRAVAGLSDPNNEVVETRTLENGLKIQRVRAPLGCLFMIFESRPNVILEAFSLAFKSGNVILLRGGSDSRATAKVIYNLIHETLMAAGLQHCCFIGLQDYDRNLVDALLTRNDLIDVVVPRGGERLIQSVVEKARMPILKNDRGLCHVYIDASADLDMAKEIVINAKTQRPGVCNSLETLLVNESVAAEVLPAIYLAGAAVNLQWRVDSHAFVILKTCKDAGEFVTKATATDWDTEHLDMILNCRVVRDLDEAMGQIDKHGSKHSEAIVTASESNARRFQAEVDAAAVYWNASTRFTDGFALGLGGELGISTQKLHVRGPVGLRELTTPRWIIDGTGQIRK